MTCFRASLNVALEWYISSSTSNGTKLSRGVARYLWKRGARRVAICLVGKAHVTKMKLNLNFFPLGFKFRR